MENVLNDLNSSIDAKNDQEILKNLKVIIEQAAKTNINETNTFKKLLSLDSSNVQTLGAESIAELCKNQENRQVFTNQDIVNRLMYFMTSGKLFH